MSAHPFRLTVVGCSGSYPGPDSPASCYLLEAEHTSDSGETRTWRVLVDLGNGALGHLHRHVDPLAIDAVLLSHLHADHCLDLCGYYVMRKYHPTDPQPQIPVWGPAGTAERMARAYDLPLEPGMGEEFDFRPYDGALEVGPFRVEAHEVEHPVTAYALRITAYGRTLAYSGDTEWTESLVEVARDADLFVCEAYVFEKRVPYHLDYRTLAAPDLEILIRSKTGAEATLTPAGPNRFTGQIKSPDGTPLPLTVTVEAERVVCDTQTHAGSLRQVITPRGVEQSDLKVK